LPEPDPIAFQKPRLLEPAASRVHLLLDAGEAKVRWSSTSSQAAGYVTHGVAVIRS